MTSFFALTARRLRVSPSVFKRHYSAPVDDSIPFAKQRFVPETVPVPKGFVFGSAYAGVKASNKSRDDVAVILSQPPCVAAGWYTRNAFAAAPVRLSKVICYERANININGVVINSGCANAITGTEGKMDALRMATTVDQALASSHSQEPLDTFEMDVDHPASNTLVMSTGVIGQRLPMDKILPAIKQAVSSAGPDAAHWKGVAKAIMTTDTFPKLVGRTFTLPSRPDTEYTMTGVSKGAGMIHPNLGTLLSVLCTDCTVGPQTLRAIGSHAVNKSFNNISIDGDTSTNDSVVVLANGAADDDAFKLEEKSEDGAVFAAVLQEVMRDLAKLVVRDGEGATKFITIRVGGTSDVKLLKNTAEVIARSALVKTAMYGKDANWGRILCAIGNLDVPSNWMQKTVDVAFVRRTEDGEEIDRLELVSKGQPREFTDADAKPYLDEEDIEIDVKYNPAGLRFNTGRNEPRQITYYTCDFSHEYVTINADYRT